MQLGIFVRKFERRFRHRLRVLMRGYLFLKKNNQLGFVRKIRIDLLDCHFSAVASGASAYIYGASIAKAEILTRQYLFQRHAGIRLNKALLYSLGNKVQPVGFPLPAVWQVVLIRHGIRVNQRKCTLAWAGLIILYWGYGVLAVVKLVVSSLRQIAKDKPSDIGRYAFFEGLSSGNLPQPDSHGRSHDICTWYSQWGGRAQKLDALLHDVEVGNSTNLDGLYVRYLGRPYRPLTRLGSVIRLMVWGTTAIFRSAWDGLRGRWWHALMLSEAAKAKAIRLSESNALAADYLFHFSGTVYRPLWTYEAEKKGARILCYFYSTYDQAKLSTGYDSQRYEWGTALWPNFLVWDDYQAALIRPDIDPSANIEVVGPIWFGTSSVEPPPFPVKSVAVFDVQPHRQSAHFGFTTLSDYRLNHPNVETRFLTDIAAVLAECGAIMVYKGKRDIGKRGVKKYRRLIQALANTPEAISVDPSVSAIKVIERCKATISMPFTSTAFYLPGDGIPSAFYDPTGWIQKDDRGAHGRPILCGIEELRDWVVSVLKDEKLPQVLDHS